MLNIMNLGFRGYKGVCGVGSFHGGGIMGLLILVIIGVVVYKMIKQNQFGGSNPLDELKMKYVNGELTEEEYMRKKEVLKKK